MFNNKYSKLLTVILIIIIIAVVGLLAFFGYDIIRKYSIESESQDAVSKFEEEIGKRPSENITNEQTNTQANTQNNITNTVDNPNNTITDVNLNEILVNTTGNTTGGNSGSSGGNSGNSGNSGGNSSSGVNVGVKYKGFDVIGLIEIPKTNIKYPIIKQEDVSIKSLDVAICNLYGELNKVGGNAVLVGHNYRNGTFFSNNKKLAKGDKIYITDNTGLKVKYIISKKYETSTGDFDYATRDVGNKRAISLSTCTDDSKRRLIIWAEEQ